MINKDFFDKDYFVGGTKSHYYQYGIAEDMIKRCHEIAVKYSPKRLLDFGCAYGYFVEQFRRMEIDAYGVDVSNYAISQSPVPRYVFETDGIHIPFPNNFFDLTVSWDVLEHIPEEHLDTVVSELNRVSQRQWHIIATVPNPVDKDKSHVTMHPLYWWKEKLPAADLQSSSDESSMLVFNGDHLTAEELARVMQ